MGSNFFQIHLISQKFFMICALMERVKFGYPEYEISLNIAKILLDAVDSDVDRLSTSMQEQNQLEEEEEEIEIVVEDDVASN
ncbi:unnamed protein product [Caenorhabditis bovis]|uniref:Uncharacterized protein n=1 Tax=Caenorhabditis bovis TaxID=2654633 RepID=A0A8S1FC47_9PELO|nr:unnamed protein product [Caenorhabditis bovis]